MHHITHQQVVITAKLPPAGWDDCSQLLPEVCSTQTVVRNFCRKWSNVCLFHFLLRNCFISILTRMQQFLILRSNS